MWQYKLYVKILEALRFSESYTFRLNFPVQHTDRGKKQNTPSLNTVTSRRTEKGSGDSNIKYVSYLLSTVLFFVLLQL